MKIYFGGIGGVGLGPLAQIALDAGHEVCGSDPTASLMRTELQRLGTLIDSDQTGNFLAQQHAINPIDWYVHTAAMGIDHPEIIKALQLGIKVSKRDELLAYLIKSTGLKLIAVAGTHGKTTTTGMLVWAMKQLGVPVSYSVGTTLSWGPSGHFDANSQYFVYECDEFDRNFLHFEPYLSLVTNIEHDHPDTYPKAEEYYQAFSQFINQSEKVVMWSRDTRHITSDNSEVWQLDSNEVADVSLAGLHNRQNATLVLKALERIGYQDNRQALLAIESFPGTNRRFEKLADNLYSDYGHTPTEIAATLQMAREISDNITLVYQPHQNTRQHEIRQQYTDSVFKDASKIYWLPTYLSREDPNLAVLTPDQLSQGLSNINVADLNDELWRALGQARSDNSLVICMGAGDIDSWTRSRLTN